MTPEHIDTVQYTWATVVPIASDAATIFYDRLFELEPALRRMFPKDLTKQKDKLVSALDWVVSSLGQYDELAPTIRDLGARHAGYGVESEHYDLVGAALLHTLEVGLGEQWNPAVEQAWTSAYGLIASTMQGATCVRAAA